jgi:hypothetical protein
MSRRPCMFRETDLKRAIKAVRAAGIDVAGVEIEPVTGKMTIMTGSNLDAEKLTDLDLWQRKRADQT